MRDRLFISYSHRDAAWLERLRAHLEPLRRTGQLDYWDDTRIAPGQVWRTEISRALAEAKVAVLLVSEAFLASEFIREQELPYLLSSAENDGLLVIPVIVSPCGFLQVEALSQYQSINPPVRPLDALPEAECEQVLQRLAAVAAEALAAAASGGAHAGATGRLVDVPARHPVFCGRQDFFALIERSFRDGPVVVLTGLNGIGKTELAIEFAYRTRTATTVALWLRAETSEALQASLVAAARALGLPQANGASEPEAVRAALRWLERNQGWLAVLDDLEPTVDVQPVLRSAQNGRVLVTSEQPLAIARRTIEVEVLDAEIAATLLLQRIGVEEAPDETVRAARRLADETGGMPLAIEQAAAYIDETGCRIDDYLALWTRHRARLMARDAGSGARSAASVASTWAVSIAALERRSASALALLRLLAFFHHENVPETLFAEAADLLGEPLGSRVADPFELNELFAALRQFSLLKRDAKSRSLRMHRLVQTFVLDGLATQERLELARRAVAVLARCFPDPKFATWPACERLLPHALACIRACAPGLVDGPALWRLLHVAGHYMHQRGNYAGARGLVRAAIDGRLAAGAAVDAALSMLVLAQTDQNTGAFADAESGYLQALALLGEADPPRPLDLARAENLLAALRLARGRMDEAAQGFERARTGFEAHGAADTADHAQVVNNIGALAYRRGDYARAEEAFRRALAIRERTLPAAHPSIAQGHNNIAAACLRQGRRAEAEASYRTALALREEQLGPAHPDVAETLFNLALLKLDEDRPSEAAPLLDRALAIQQAAQGSGHPDCARSIAALGEVALKRGEVEAACRRYEESLRIREAALHAEHPDVGRSLVGLASAVERRGERERARSLLVRARDIFARTLGLDHPDYRSCEARLRELA